MLGFSHQQRFYIYRNAVDMRNGYDGLSGLVRNELKEDPLKGDVYVFFNSKRQIVKLLVWDKDGYVIYGKRLEKGRFEKIEGIMEGKKHGIEYQHLVMLLSGISLLGMNQRPRYQLGTR